MKHPLLIISGVITLCGALFIAVILGILFFVKPFGIDMRNVPGAMMNTNNATTKSTYDHPLLNTDQETLLQNLGVDTKALPTSITAAQMSCFTSALGASRVQEIQNGSAITVTDYFKAKSCL